MTDDNITYGAQVDSDQLAKSLEHVLENNLKMEQAFAKQFPEAKPKRPTPICIWGTHGIGKTAMINTFAEKRGWKMKYIAPAQFEEMGDLHGLPVKYDPNPEKLGDEVTLYVPPEWVPKKEEVGPGILVIDDINRADDRILRGIMQLLQNFEMFSWALPPQWQIVCTANPEGGDYSVTSMDDAMLTRFLHFTMVFDVKAWAAWATAANVDPRGIAFVLTYPEVITGKRTTARTLTQFFEQIVPIENLKADIELVSVLAQGTLDSITATTFIAFVNDELEALIDPEDILNAKDFKVIKDHIHQLATGKGDEKRVDRIATICTRLFLLISSDKFVFKPAHKDNLVSFLMHEDIPGDLRFSLHKDLANIGGKVAEALRDPKLAKLVLSNVV
jgi:MoxR-like ATPase